MTWEDTKPKEIGGIKDNRKCNVCIYAYKTKCVSIEHIYIEK